MKFKLPMLAFLVFGVSVQAQEVPEGAAPVPRAVPPPGPLLQSAPEFSQWEVRFIYLPDPAKKDQAPSAAAAPVKNVDVGTQLRQVTTTKTGKIIHEVSSYMNGNEIDKWYDGPIQYQKRPATKDWGMKLGGAPDGKYADRTYVPFPTNGFRDLGWVNATTYVGTIPYGDRRCLAFSQLGADTLDLKDPQTAKKLLDAQQTVAYIDAETRLPISMRSGRVVSAYHFDVPPTEAQTLPADLAGEIKKGQEARARVQQVATRPY